MSATIPDDIMEAARSVAYEITNKWRDEQARIIARAIMAERESATNAESERRAIISAALSDQRGKTLVECIEICESIERRWAKRFKETDRTYDVGSSDGAHECTEALRGLLERRNMAIERASTSLKVELSGEDSAALGEALRSSTEKIEVIRSLVIGDIVTHPTNPAWRGRIVGFYSSKLTPVGYAVDSINEPGDIQIYPEGALAAVTRTDSEFTTSTHRTRMIVCPTCGNKRCPKATDHRFECTGSNQPGQEGSIYGEAKP